jgi:hypothetical protein
MSWGHYGVVCLIFQHALWIFFDIFLQNGDLSPDYPQLDVIFLAAGCELR